MCLEVHLRKLASLSMLVNLLAFCVVAVALKLNGKKFLLKQAYIVVMLYCIENYNKCSLWKAHFCIKQLCSLCASDGMSVKTLH